MTWNVANFGSLNNIVNPSQHCPGHQKSDMKNFVRLDFDTGLCLPTQKLGKSHHLCHIEKENHPVKSECPVWTFLKFVLLASFYNFFKLA